MTQHLYTAWLRRQDLPNADVGTAPDARIQSTRAPSSWTRRPVTSSRQPDVSAVMDCLQGLAKLGAALLNLDAVAFALFGGPHARRLAQRKRGITLRDTRRGGDSAWVPFVVQDP